MMERVVCVERVLTGVAVWVFMGNRTLYARKDLFVSIYACAYLCVNMSAIKDVNADGDGGGSRTTVLKEN